MLPEREAETSDLRLKISQSADGSSGKISPPGSSAEGEKSAVSFRSQSWLEGAGTMFYHTFFQYIRLNKYVLLKEVKAARSGLSTLVDRNRYNRLHVMFSTMVSPNRGSYKFTSVDRTLFTYRSLGSTPPPPPRPKAAAPLADDPKASPASGMPSSTNTNTTTTTKGGVTSTNKGKGKASVGAGPGSDPMDVDGEDKQGKKMAAPTPVVCSGSDTTGSCAAVSGGGGRGGGGEAALDSTPDDVHSLTAQLMLR